jgi:hypothetical protein
MTDDQKSFVKLFVKEIREHNAAIFAGAGLSIPSGFVSWSELLQPLAKGLSIKIEKMNDLVALTQYYINSNGGNRHQVNQLILESIGKDGKPNVNHKILARLPIETYWTVNYDKLIEQSLIDVGKRPDVKYTVSQLASTKPQRDSVVYKMHGDVDHPDQAIISRDDYENYHKRHKPFITALSGDLVSKTFLFIGISFVDPNLNYILSRVRSEFTTNGRQHYCILKSVQKSSSQDDDDFQNAKILQNLFIEDLKRFNIKTLIIENYSEITSILLEIEKQYKSDTIFISGSLSVYEKYSMEQVTNFIEKLTRALLDLNSKFITGFGKGVGNNLVSSVIREVFNKNLGKIENYLIMRPFPQTENFEAQDRNKYRNEMLDYAGIVIFLFGNKLDKNSGEIILSNGMIEEFKIAQSKKMFMIPLASSGEASQEIYNMLNETQYFNTHAEVLDLFEELNKPKKFLEEYIDCIVKLVKYAKGVT